LVGSSLIFYVLSSEASALFPWTTVLLSAAVVEVDFLVVLVVLAAVFVDFPSLSLVFYAS